MLIVGIIINIVGQLIHINVTIVPTNPNIIYNV